MELVVNWQGVEFIHVEFPDKLVFGSFKPDGNVNIIGSYSKGDATESLGCKLTCSSGDTIVALNGNGDLLDASLLKDSLDDVVESSSGVHPSDMANWLARLETHVY